MIIPWIASFFYAADFFNNPIFTFEMVTLGRRRRYFLLRFLYGLALLVMGLAFGAFAVLRFQKKLV